MIDGLLIGSVYGLAAMGLSLIWGVMDVINLTHGSVIALGMFGMYILFAAFPVNAYFLLLPHSAGGIGAGANHSLDLGALGNRSLAVVELLSTFAVNMMIIGIGTAIWSTSPYNVNFSLRGIYRGSLHFHRQPHCGRDGSGHHCAGAGTVSVSHTAGQGHPRGGRQPEAAELMGISTTMVLALAFAIGIALAASSGALVSTLFPFTILSGAGYQMKSFVVTVLADSASRWGRSPPAYCWACWKAR